MTRTHLSKGMASDSASANMLLTRPRLLTCNQLGVVFRRHVQLEDMQLSSRVKVACMHDKPLAKGHISMYFKAIESVLSSQEA